MKYIVYTDGSYKEFPGVGAFYSSAATIAREDGQHQTSLTKVGNDADILAMRNTAGEIIAVMMVMEHCLNVLKLTQDDEVIVNYDYKGIESWCLRKGHPDYWRCKTPVTQAYRDYINGIVRPRFKVTFNHVRSHTGVSGNENVDALARKAMAQYVNTLVG